MHRACKKSVGYDAKARRKGLISKDLSLNCTVHSQNREVTTPGRDAPGAKVRRKSLTSKDLSYKCTVHAKTRRGGRKSPGDAACEARPLPDGISECRGEFP